MKNDSNNSKFPKGGTCYVKKNSEKISNDSDCNDIFERGETEYSYRRTIDQVVTLLQNEIDQLERVIDELTEESPVGLKFDLLQACYERLHEYAIVEQNKIEEIFGFKN